MSSTFSLQSLIFYFIYYFLKILRIKYISIIVGFLKPEIIFVIQLNAYHIRQRILIILELYIQKQLEIEDGRGILRAIVKDDRKYIREQLINGLNPDMRVGKIPVIFFPIYLEKPDMLSIFLEFGANPNKTLMGESPLNFAIYRNSIPSAYKLIENGANINSKNAGKTPLDHALREKNYEFTTIFASW